jgi:hypothetical protein
LMAMTLGKDHKCGVRLMQTIFIFFKKGISQVKIF